VNRLLLEVAVHEAGHSVIARVVGLRSGRATLSDHDGVARAYFADDGSLNNVVAVLAGRAATEVILGRASDYDCSIDDDIAKRMLAAKGFVGFGMRTKLYDARALIRQHRAAVERVARALLVRGTLSGDEIDALCRR
jgi:ATP-dependent Zn protease